MREFPRPLWRAVGMRAYLRSMREFSEYLSDEQKWQPDVIMGVHYGGMGFAADLARIHYTDLVRAIIEYKEGEDGTHVCKSVRLDCDTLRIHGRRVLIVDNSIHSGRTLRLVRDEVAKSASETKTLVVFQPPRAGDEKPPDYVLFVGRWRCRQLLR